MACNKTVPSSYGKQPKNSLISVLQEDIMILIVQKLDLVGYHRFSLVCKSWQSIAITAKKIRQFILRPQLPWLMLSCTKSKDGDHHRFFSLFHDEVFKLELPEVYGARCCGCNWGWLIMVGNMGRIFLLNPFTRVSIILPHQSTLPPLGLGVLFKCIEQSSNYIRKAMLFPTTNDSNLDGNNVESSCLVVAIYDMHRFAFCRPGDETWTPFENHHLGESLEDIIFYDGKLYAIKLQYDLILVELGGCYPRASSCNIAPPTEREEDITLPLPSNEMVKTVYLVECLGELLMVVRCALFHGRLVPPKTATFSIFKLDLQGRCWIKVNNLGDQMLFIGTSTGCSVSTLDYPQFKGNCIYFTDVFSHHPTSILHRPTACEDLGVFHLENYNIEPFLSNVSHSKLFPPIWFTPISW